MLINKENYLLVAVYLLFIVYWLFLIRPAWLGELGGTFKAREVPPEYVRLKDFIHQQPRFFRTFWIPKRQRFGFFSNNHPAIDALNILKVSSPSAVVNWLKKEEAKEQLSRWAVKYVIIPYDSEKEIFLKDRKYDENGRKKVEEELKRIKWLKWLNGWDKIAVFETPEFRDHFWREDRKQITENRKQRTENRKQKTENRKQRTENREQRTENREQRKDLRLKWEMINPTRYEVAVENVNKPFTLVFSESFDKNWVAIIENKEQRIDNRKQRTDNKEQRTDNRKQKTDNKEQKTKNRNIRKIYSQRTDDGLNSFAINKKGSYTIEVYYEPQKWVNYGLVISGLTMGLVILCFKSSIIQWLKKVFPL